MATPGPNLASSWTTPEQFAWLKERLPEFIERRAAAKGKISPWLSAIYDAWFAAFPLEPLTEAELQEADGDEEEARKTKVTKRKDQVYWWFYNRRNGEKTGKRVTEDDRKTTIDLTKRAKKHVLPYQAYMSLYRKTLGPKVKEAYKQHVASVPQGEVSKWLPFMTQMAREMYEAESEEVKAEVEKYRKKLSESGSALVGFTDASAWTDDLSLSEEAHEIQRSINNLPRAINNMLDNIERLTGWKATIFLGGPNPEDGMITSYIAHRGQTITAGNTFPKSTTQWDAIESAWEKFLAACYKPSLLSNLHNAYLAWDDDDAEVSPETPKTSEESRGSGKGKEKDEEPSPASSTSDVESENEFEKTRAANIARNRALWLEVNEHFDELQQVAAPSQSGTTRSSTTLANTTTANRPSVSQSATTTTNASGPSSTTAHASPTTSTPTAHEKSTSVTPVTTPLEPTTTTRSADRSPATGDDASSNGTDTQPNTRDASSRRPQQLPPELPESEQQGDTSSSPPARVTWLEVPAGLPQWAKDAVDCFQGLNAALYPVWPRVVHCWTLFESSGNFDGKGRLSCKHRPEEIKFWISRGRRYDRLPIVKSTAQYATLWKRWWMSMQPECRQPKEEASWPPQAVLPKSPGQWTGLRIGGTNGIFIVMVSLAIWLAAESAEMDRSDALIGAMEDVEWVLNALTTTRPGSKRAAIHDLESKAKKRKTGTTA